MSRLPTVTNLVLVLLKNLTHFVSPAVGNPQIASPVPTSHTTTELSSCPPRDARDIRCTISLVSRSQTIMSAANPMNVICPDARYLPSAETHRHETSSV
eukprot:30936-Pelagococcus_subviridis.AAC.16